MPDSRILLALLAALVPLSSLLAQKRPEGVPAEAQSFDGHWYLPVAGKADPESAAAACAKGGGYLAVVNSADEHRFLRKLLSEQAETRFWIGGSRKAGTWKWAGGDPMAKGAVALVARKDGPLHVALRTQENQRDLIAIPADDTRFPVGGYLCEWGESQKFVAPEKSGSAPGGARKLSAESRSIACILGSAEDSTPVISKITATASPSEDGFHLRIQGKVEDPAVSTALKEVGNLMLLRHGAGIKGTITLSCSGGGTDVVLDEGSALVWAVLADCLLAGKPVDESAMMLGDINADGKTQPTLAILIRLQTLEGKSLRLGIPQADAVTLIDLYLAGEPGVVCANSVVGMATLDDALAFVDPDPDPARAASRKAYGEMQALYASRSREFHGLLKHAKVTEKLRGVTAGCPDHISAKVLLAAGSGRLPKSISLVSSQFFIMDKSEAILKAINDDKFPQNLGDPKPIIANISEIRRIRGQLAPKTHRMADALVTLGGQIEDWIDGPPGTVNGKREYFQALEETIREINREQALFRTAVRELR